ARCGHAVRSRASLDLALQPIMDTLPTRHNPYGQHAGPNQESLVQAPEKSTMPTSLALTASMTWAAARRESLDIRCRSAKTITSTQAPAGHTTALRDSNGGVTSMTRSAY